MLDCDDFLLRFDVDVEGLGGLPRVEQALRTAVEQAESLCPDHLAPDWVVADLALYRLYSQAASEDVRNRYNEAVKFLRHLDEGTIEPASPTPNVLFSSGRRWC